ncbi:extracellular solute-binding protein [Paenibacillus sp. P25]|nr:extracellular solute-binding protein [Paenibacillus sp. P25]
MFEKQNPDIKVKMVYIPSGTAAQPTYDRILAAKQAGKGSGGIDLYEDGVATITKGQKEDLWDTLNGTSIPNISKVDPQTMKDVSNLAVPYRSSAVVLAYNGDKVTSAPNTLDELYDWIRKHPGKFAYNDPSTGGSGDSFVQTAIYKSAAAGSDSQFGSEHREAMGSRLCAAQRAGSVRIWKRDLSEEKSRHARPARQRRSGYDSGLVRYGAGTNRQRPARRNRPS